MVTRGKFQWALWIHLLDVRVPKSHMLPELLVLTSALYRVSNSDTLPVVWQENLRTQWRIQWEYGTKWDGFPTGSSRKNLFTFSYGAFLQWWYPQIIPFLVGSSTLNHPFGGTPNAGKRPYACKAGVGK